MAAGAADDDPSGIATLPIDILQDLGVGDGRAIKVSANGELAEKLQYARETEAVRVIELRIGRDDLSPQRA